MIKALILIKGYKTKFGTDLEDTLPMNYIVGKPFLEHQIEFLKSQNVKEMIFVIDKNSDNIKSYFGNGLSWGVEITYLESEIPLGSAGAIKKAEKYLGDMFIIMNGDSYSHVDIGKLIEVHERNRLVATICLTRAKDSSDYGYVVLEKEKIKSFSEKSFSGEGLVNSGVYLFSRGILDWIEEDKFSSLEIDVFPKLSLKGSLAGYLYDGYFMDLKKPETYKKFREDVLSSLLLKPTGTVKDALKKIVQSGINIVLIVDESIRLQGVLTDRIIKNFLLNGGDINDFAKKAMIDNPIIARNTDSKEKINEILLKGINSLPIIDEQGKVIDVEFRTDRIKENLFPIVRGRAPLRIGLAGGGTDLPNFFEKYGGVVISSTIDKYCYGTIIKRADNKIIIDSDITSDKDVTVSSIKDLKYDGKFDLIKAIIKLMNPDFGFELYLHNDVPPGRGLGSSASLSVLVISLLAYMQNKSYDEYKIAEIAYNAEREELKIRGGWQDQYAAAIGGFNFMEFSKDKTLVYPLRIKKDIIRELNGHMLLCYVGQEHFSSDIHKSTEEQMERVEGDVLSNLKRIKEIALETKDCLLKNEIKRIGELLHESWENKRKLGNKTSNPVIDEFYEIGLKNGAYGGKLLGAGGGGYILFFYSPKKRNQLVRALKNAGGEIMTFNFESEGVTLWTSKNKI